MNRKTVIATMLTLFAGTIVFARVETSFMQYLRTLRSEVRWVPSSELQTDLDGDWMPENVALGNVPPDGVVLAIKATTTGKMHFVEYKVSPGDADAFCSVPVKLTKVPLKCSVNGTAIPGCEEGARASALVLKDGTCAPFNVYWNHEQHGPVSWKPDAG
jgi:hypothetical protein